MPPLAGNGPSSAERKERTMALWATRRAGALGVLAAAWLGLIGCSGGSPKTGGPKAADVQPDAGPKTAPKPDAAAVQVAAVPGAVQPAKAGPPIDDPLYHPF